MALWSTSAWRYVRERRASDGRRQRAPYQWVIEGDIKGCFDHIDHHRLMQRVRARIGEVKVTRVVGQFLRAGVLEKGLLHPTHEGTHMSPIDSLRRRRTNQSRQIVG